MPAPSSSDRVRGSVERQRSPQVAACDSARLATGLDEPGLFSAEIADDHLIMRVFRNLSSVQLRGRGAGGRGAGRMASMITSVHLGSALSLATNGPPTSPLIAFRATPAFLIKPPTACFV